MGLEHNSTTAIIMRWVISYRKVHLTDFQMALWFFPPNPLHLVPQTCENKHWKEATTIVCLWRSPCNIHLCVNGRYRLLFVPSPTVCHTILQQPRGKSHLQAMAPYVIYRIDQMYFLKEQRRGSSFSLHLCTESKEKVLERD